MYQDRKQDIEITEIRIQRNNELIKKLEEQRNHLEYELELYREEQKQYIIQELKKKNNTTDIPCITLDLNQSIIDNESLDLFVKKCFQDNKTIKIVLLKNVKNINDFYKIFYKNR